MFPRSGAVHVAGDRDTLQRDLPALGVVQVEPALLTPDDDPVHHCRYARCCGRWPCTAAARLLNGLYLQSALIVSRSHPSAVKGARNKSVAAARRDEAVAA